MSVRPYLSELFRNRSQTVVRLCLAAGISIGVLTILFYILFRPSPDNTFGVFYAAAQSGLEGRIIYDTRYGLYVYTPVALVYFIPYALFFDLSTAVLMQRLLSIGVAIMYGIVLVRFLAGHTSLDRLDKGLIILFMTIGLYPVVAVVLAGIEILLGACLGIGFIFLESDREEYGGILWATASLFKIFPALWGLYFLLTGKWRAIASAITTGIGASLLGIILFGYDAYVRFVQTVTQGRVRIDAFSGGASPDNEAVTPIRPLSQLFPDIDPHVWPPIIFVVVAVLLAYIYLRMDRRTLADRTSLLVATVIAVEFVMPTSQDLDMYLLVGPLAILLYTERHSILRVGLAIATVIFTFNLGRGEIDAVSAAIGPNINDVVMLIAKPILSFASMPLYGMVCLFALCLLRARWQAVDKFSELSPERSDEWRREA